ncbi:hypothetical protein ACFFP0_09590 [Rhizobium puerariae]|uniref:Uncharacterized protein n=1 Tax=Rhizobium puerariae TaxID=1585791 RepID=A0ABV6AEQ7_9HYPH
MPANENYRKIASMDLRPAYISLGLKRAAFKDQGRRRSRLFDAALNADPSQPDAVWLFKGANYLRFNVDIRQNKFEQEAKVIAGNFGGNTWPLMFSSGIDAAAWGGPAFPHVWFMFKDNQYIRLNSTNGGSWVVETGPEPIVNAWWSARDTWFTNGCDAALHGLGAKHHGKLHLFKDGEYIRHNYFDGHKDIGPIPVAEAWALPEPFSKKIELAFYGTGTEEEHAFFFSGEQVAQYDTGSNEVVRIMPIEERFPSFAEFMSRPQLFLVEDYCLETYVGPPTLGRLVDTKNVPPGVTINTLMVTETIDVNTSQLRQSILESQDAGVVKNFNEQMDNRTDASESRDAYRYQMNADFHGDASANSLWGGEVNASLGVSGSTDSRRSSIAQSAFETISSQVTESTRQLNQRTYDSAESIEHRERVLKQESITLTNTSEQMRSFEFYQQLQPTYALLVLKDIRVAYGDGSGAGLTEAKLPALRNLLDDKLLPEHRDQLLGFIAGELKEVEDYEGAVVSILASGDPPSLQRNPTALFKIQLPSGETQEIAVRGQVIKGVKDWMKPTYTITAIQR